MRLVRQRILPVAHLSRPQSHSHGRIATQMPNLLAQLQSASQPENTHAGPHVT